MTKTTRTYRYGGPLIVGQDYYIPRKADDQLLQWCLQSEYAYIFNASQTGKSSLLERTRAELEKRGICAAYIDLQGLGSTADAEDWYRNVADMIAGKLELHTDVESWWAAHSSQTPTRRWLTFFEQVVLMEIEKPLVVFIDEVDRTRSLPFRADIYGALRSLYSGRPTRPKLRRLSFVLAGLAAPHELIGDPTGTAHNIWKGVSLGDLTEKDGAIDELADGLGLGTAEERKEALGWILSWTGGHPYLTQKMCARVQDQEWEDCHPQDVDQLVAEEFLSGENEDNNLSYVDAELTKERHNGVTRTAILAEYERVLTDGKVRDTNTAAQVELKQTGVVKVEEGWVRVRNRIYQEAFDKVWLRRHFHPSWREWWAVQPRRVKVLIRGLVITVVLLFGTTMWALVRQNQVDQAVRREGARDLAALSYVMKEPFDLLFPLEALYRTRQVGQPPVLEVEQALHDTLALRALRRIDFFSAPSRAEPSGIGPIASLGEITPNGISSGYSSVLPPIRILKTHPSEIVVTGSDDGTVITWPFELITSNWHFFGSAPSAKTDSIIQMKISPEGTWLFTDKLNDTAEIQLFPFNVFGTEESPTVLLGYKSGSVVDFSPDERWLAALSDGVVRVWGTQDWQSQPKWHTQPKVLSGQGDWITEMVFSKDSSRLIAGTDTGALFVWKLEDQNARPVVLSAHGGSIMKLELMPNEQLVTSSENGIVQLWDLKRPEKHVVVMQGIDFMHNWSFVRVALALSPDGRRMATGEEDGTVRLWSLKNPTSASVVLASEQTDPITALAFSSDGQWLVAESNWELKGTIQVWNLTSPGIKSWILNGVEKWLISTDERRLVTLRSGIVQIWDLGNLDARSIVLRGPQEGPIFDMELTIDRQRLVTGGLDGRPQLWELSFERLVEKACLEAGRNFTQEEWAEYFRGEDYRKTCEQWPAGE